MTSCEVKHINLSVRELYYTADFSAEMRFFIVPSLCGFQRLVNLDENSFTVARKLSSESVVYLVGPIRE